MGATLYVIPGSHPCECVEAALKLKGVDYKRVDLVPAIHAAVVRVSGFPGRTVPAIKVNGEKVQGSRKILRKLDELAPEPRLVPEDPALRAKVEEAEAWGDDVFQPLARRVAWGGFIRDRPSMLTYSAEGNLHMPAPFLKLGSAPVSKIAQRINGASDEQVEADLAALPGYLDKIDAWIAEGVLGGETPNVADLQIGSSIRILTTFGDIKPLIAGRPAEKLATNGFAPAVGAIPAGTYPPAWLAQTR
ncbi:MAG TPA: glutathione S-transferase [Thermoleophilaceae bacterium]